MPRKNGNAGQPNRAAQMTRRADRRIVNAERKTVYGPGSEHLELPTRLPVRNLMDRQPVVIVQKKEYAA